MTVAAGSYISPSGGGSRLFPVLFFLAPLVTSAVPRLTPLFLPLIGFALIVASLRRGLGWRQLLQPSPAVATSLLLSLYLFINASWAWDQSSGLGKAAVLLSAILIAFAAATAAATLDERQIRRAAIAFVAGASVGGLYLLLELLTDGAITRAAMNLIPVLQPDRAKHLKIVDGNVMRISLGEFNQNATVLMLHLWPGLLILSALEGIPRRTLVLVLFFLALVVPILISDHDSSQVALLVSALVLLLAWHWRRSVTRGVAMLWCLSFALVLPLNFLAYDAKLHLVQSLPDPYQARIIIWEYTSERTLEHPWLGIGVNSTVKMDNAAIDETKFPSPAERPEGFVYKRTTAHHAHNIFLQSWYELGAVGAVLLALAGALVVMRIALLPLLAQPFAAATFAAFAAIAAFSWGMWQTWFMCAIAIVPIYLCIAAGTIRECMPELARQVPGRRSIPASA